MVVGRSCWVSIFLRELNIILFRINYWANHSTEYSGSAFLRI